MTRTTRRGCTSCSSTAPAMRRPPGERRLDGRSRSPPDGHHRVPPLGRAAAAVVAPGHGDARAGVRLSAHAFGFQGAPGDRGGAGGDGPDVTVRLGIVRSPYVERLLIAGIEIGYAPPFYHRDRREPRPARDWLLIRVARRAGRPWLPRRESTKGTDAQAGCPSADGGPAGGVAEGVTAARAQGRPHHDHRPQAKSRSSPASWTPALREAPG